MNRYNGCYFLPFDASNPQHQRWAVDTRSNLDALFRLRQSKRPWIKRLWAYLWTKTTPHARNHS